MTGRSPLATRRCRILGHKWRPSPIRYERGTVMGRVGDGDLEPLTVTWVIDEVCDRCGCESRWPS